MQIERPSVILFDWDMTLISHQPILIEIREKILSEMGGKISDINAIEQYKNYSLKDSFAKIFGEHAEDAKKKFYSHFLDTHLEYVEPLPFAFETIKYLKDSGIDSAIVSNKTASVLRKEVLHIGWDQYFYGAYGSGDFIADKPNKDPVDYALSMHADPSLDRSLVWFVGDSVVDMYCGRDSGCVPILIGDTDNKEATSIAKAHVKNHQEFLNLIISL